MNKEQYEDVLDAPALASGRVYLNTSILKKHRRKLGFSQLGLAEYSFSIRQPISIASIKRAELGKPVIYRTAQQLAKLFDDKIESLVLDTLKVTSGDKRATQRDKSDTAHQISMVGRERELKYISSLISELINSKLGHFIYVRGDAGIGKSRLLEEISDLVEAKFLHVVRCKFYRDNGNAGVMALGPLVLGCIGLDLTSAQDLDSDLIQQHLSELGFTDDTFIYVSNILGVELEAKSQDIFNALTHDVRTAKLRKTIVSLIQVASRTKPLVLFVDDAHWASEYILTMLGRVISETRKEPALWIMTSRHENDPLETGIRPYLDDLSVNLIELSPLSDSDSMALALLLLPELNASQVKVISQSKGNPLFLTQLISSSESNIIPKSLMEIVDFKINLLNAKDLFAIQLAAAYSYEIDLATLRELIDDAQYFPHAPLKLRIFRHFGDNSFVYMHDLVMRSVYSRILAPDLQSIHLQIADYFEDKDDKIRALHLVSARSPLAAEALLATAHQKYVSFNFVDALDLLATYKGIEYIPINEFQMHYLEGMILSSMGQSEKARAAFHSAMTFASDISDSLAVAVQLARVLNVLDELAAEASLLDSYIPKAENSGDDKALGQLLYLKGNLLFPRGEHHEARKLQLAAREAARRSNDPHTEALALSGLGDSYYAKGHMLTATGIYRDCLSVCERIGIKHVESSNRFMLATTRLYLNESVLALQDALASAELGAKVGNLRSEIVSRLTAGWLYTSLENIPAAMAQYETALIIVAQIGAKRFEPFLMEGISRCHFISGDHIKAKEIIYSAWRLVEQQSLQKFIGPWVLGTLALIDSAENNNKNFIEQGLEIISSGCLAHNHYRFYVSAAESYIISRDLNRASSMADNFESFTHEEPCPWSEHQIQLIRSHVGDLLDPFNPQSPKTNALIAAGASMGLAGSSPVLHAILPSNRSRN